MRPPPFVLWRVDQVLPGIWPRFIQAAIAGTRSASQVSSWYRGPEQNAAVGGHPQSQHLLGLAFDVLGPDLSQLQADLRIAGFNTVTYRNHVHAQTLEAGQAASFGLFP